MPKPTTNSDDTSDIVEEEQGDLFQAPENAVLIHACNCMGSWGAGIAKGFKTRYPAAYKVHHDHCTGLSADQLIGTCQLIPPQRDDYEKAAVNPSRRPPSKRRRVGKLEDDARVANASTDSKRHWVACLFTSKGYGKPTKTHPGMDKPDVILENTRKSLIDLKEQLLKLQQDGGEGKGQHSSTAEEQEREDRPGELWSCKFNSGLFAVDWADSKKVLEEELKSLGRTVRVVSPAES